MSEIVLHEQVEATLEASKIIIQWITGEKTIALIMPDGLVPRLCRAFPGKITAPTNDDDEGDGYAVSDLWIDEVASKVYVCTDPTAGYAVWEDLTGGGGGAATQIIETSGPTTLDIAAIADGEFLKRDGTDIVGATPAGAGDMEAATYDPQTIQDDAFDCDNHTDGLVNGVYTLAERAALAGVPTTYVPNSTYDANSILKADSDNTPAALVVAEQTLVGRITAGVITALTATQVRALLDVEEGADVTDAANVAAAGAVMENDYNAHTILAATADNTPAALEVTEQTVVGRITGGAIAALTATQLRTLLDVEEGADVTDATNVAAAGAVMETDYNANTILAATSDDTPAALEIAEQTLVGRITAGAIAALTATQVRTLLNVENGATADQDASEVPYTPAEVADWDDCLDPGDVADALDQLAERVKDIEVWTDGDRILVTDKLTGVLKTVDELLWDSDNGRVQIQRSDWVGWRGLSAGDAVWPQFIGARARGTVAVPTAVQDDDVLNELKANPHDGTGFVNAGRIRIVANQTFDSDSHGTRVEFWLVPDDSTTETLIATLEPDGTFNLIAGGSFEVDGVAAALLTTVQTLTNKRITKRAASTTDDATAVIDSDSYDEYYLTAIASNTEITITGTPTAGQTIFIGLKDAGVSKTITWTGITALGTTLPTATTAGKQHIIGLKYIASAWRAIAVGVEE